MTFSHSAVLGLCQVNPGSLLHYVFLWLEKFTNVNGHFTDYNQSRGRGCNGCKPNNLGSIVIVNQMQTGGGQKSGKFANVIYECPLITVYSLKVPIK